MNPAKGPVAGRPRAHVVSLGCPKNWVDSEVMLGYLRQGGLDLTEGPEDADLIVVNSCAFIREAKEEALETILEMARWKERGPCRTLVVVGCLPQRYGAELLGLLPEVDLFLGTGEIPRIAERLRDLEGGGPRACHVPAPDYLFDHRQPRLRSGGAATAYVKIAEGCSNRCTYCAVPLIRGPLRSRPVNSVVEEVRDLVAGGVKEVILVAQDTAAYGLDRGEAGALGELLGALDGVAGLEWIRVLYAHPAHVGPELLAVLPRIERLCPYLDLPVQHIAPRILDAMNRKVGPDEVRSVIARLREAVPGIHLRTTLIVGFPGESDAEFEELLAFVRESRFEWLGAFAYSREEGTAAAALGPPVRAATVRRRLGRLMEVQGEITRQALGRWVGRVVPVLVEQVRGGAGRDAVGRTAFQAPEIDGQVHLSGDGLEPGEMVQARVTVATGYDLMARTVGDRLREGRRPATRGKAAGTV